MHHIFFIHSFVNGHLSCFPLLAIVYSAMQLYLCLYVFGLHWLSLAECGLSLIAASGGFSCVEAQALGVKASVVVTHGLSCPVACGVFPDQGWNPCPLHWQVDSYPLYHQGSRLAVIFKRIRMAWIRLMRTYCENSKIWRISHMIIFIKEKTKMKRKRGKERREREENDCSYPNPRPHPCSALPTEPQCHL